MLAFALAGVAQAAAQAGDAGAARAAVVELERTPLGTRASRAELGLGARLERGGAGELSAARALARDAAERRAGARARTRTRWRAACALPARRPGGRRARRSRSWRRVDGPYAAPPPPTPRRCRRRRRRAARAAERFAEHDALLVAVEAADAAAAAYREAGRRSSARAAAARAGLWLTHCEGARPPTLLGAPEAAGLTPREREIALLAAGGSSSREIAGAPRALRAHGRQPPQNAYRKLGVTSRTELSGVLTGTPE